MLKILILFYLGIMSTTAEHNHYDHIKKKMEDDGIIPSIISDAPHHHLHVSYPNDKKVHLGEELTPSDVKDDPQATWEASPEKYYVLVMFDPDAPSRQNTTFADVKHWLVVNIKGANVSSGEIIAEYIGSGPPKGTGLHRYIFLAYEQKNKLEFNELKSGKLSRANRLKWSLKKFVETYDLGKPIAGDYFQAQWEPYVDERNKNVTN